MATSITLAGMSFLAVVAALALLSRVLPPGFLAAGTNARSNHRAPARQIGGLGIVPVAVAAMLVWSVMEPGAARFCLAAAAAMALLFVIGLVDDARDLGAMPKLGGQFAAAAIMLWGLPADGGIASWHLPAALMIAIPFVALVWFVNLTNFMDGLDLMAVTGVGVPMLVAALLLVSTGGGTAVACLAAVLGGAFLGFALFNRPPAGLFLGDNGSLPAGLATGAIVMASAPAIPVELAWIPFGYFIVDATSTVVLRLARGANVLEAHSEHAYQIAFRSGRSAWWVCGHVLAATLAASALVPAAGRTGAGTAFACIAALAIHGGLCLYLRAQPRRSA